MPWRNQIETCTNAANTSAVKQSEKDVKIITVHHVSTDSERLLSAASHVSDEKRKGWLLLLVTMMIEIAKWPQTINIVKKLQNVIKYTQITCIQTTLHKLASPGLKFQSATKICAKSTRQLLSTICNNFFKGMCDKHLPKFVMRII